MRARSAATPPPRAIGAGDAPRNRAYRLGRPGSSRRRDAGIGRAIQVGAPAWGDPVADLETLGEAQLLQFADVRLERPGGQAADRGEIWRAPRGVGRYQLEDVARPRALPAGLVEPAEPSVDGCKVRVAERGVGAQRNARVGTGVAQLHPIHPPGTTAEEPQQFGAAVRARGPGLRGGDAVQAHHVHRVDRDKPHRRTVQRAWLGVRPVPAAERQRDAPLDDAVQHGPRY